jgi:hypothetical protein
LPTLARRCAHPVRTFSSWKKRLQSGRRPIQTSRSVRMLLGVTPEIAGMDWPERSSLIAVDSSLPMAQAVWPGNLPQRWVVCGNWLALPQREPSCHVVIADGSFNCLPYPDGFRALAKTVSRVLCSDGILVLRCYIRSRERETPEGVCADVAADLSATSTLLSYGSLWRCNTARKKVSQ